MNIEKTRELFYYVDDSGSRDPDRNRNRKDKAAGVPDWFALGGIIVEAVDKAEIEARLDEFKKHWPEIKDAPLRSYNIRNKSGAFRWLSELSAESQDTFYKELTGLMIGIPIVVAGCVVHRPGYNERYLKDYGERRWKLCKTAFNITVERAAKYAASKNAKLRVFVEQSDKPTEAQLKMYYDEMRAKGAPFDASRAAKYAPLTPSDLASTLREFRIKTKRSHLMQLADLALWPICKGGYSSADQSYTALRDNAKLLDAQCTEGSGLLGIKYFCFPG